MNKHKFPYEWKLGDTVFTKDKGKVFSCFSCGGGSTMGYKLAGFDVIGCNEIDHRMMSIYRKNHNPTFSFLEPIQDFRLREDLPNDLYNLDILDGSPPCSTFSMAGSREDAWGVEKRFREGQAEQILDRLFFDFIDLTKKLQPKIAISENVKGMLLGNAIRYVREIYEAFDSAGYYCQHFLLDAATMGVPQHRERVFFICLRKDIATPFLRQKDMFECAPYIDMEFKEKEIPCNQIDLELGEKKMPCLSADWERLKAGEPAKYLQSGLIKQTDVYPTITAGYGGKACPMPDWDNSFPSAKDVCKISTFPIDYDFMDQSANYVCGMSVPPVMMAQVASRVYDYWLSKIKN
ncbi:DNA (cytosine-5)-methyltransferase 1 [Dysgonomonas sp. PFB1-18]|uniref:DNA cytosine methyltransferase n=1 Tax=unclassified Dysgonomonas TaxID=2630389 RepID=UPI0024741B5C|nr:MULTISPECIES: DNA (cytosine-5-)-methyltransferase [unclassified Dysgonomonas]MDH6307999.1 DNA (cytosine-5)-methyltransferase 1 [Dysgonomonas sp. PF1-14]MDH6339538.1 DNA (cytosine-5)-methyltransferase 1 [Dysgonomonas sp. PF1-16]MDH6381189.1 DNA (cytosine-5)-methyltransferase 1 [Dysgonomonas sp. PFB1-18]MDH6398401.1 DNA (cytosine-5)-methyltransferase 1 [Dysgonomonas sp. PF1-23]